MKRNITYEALWLNKQRGLKKRLKVEAAKRGIPMEELASSWLEEKLANK